MVGQGRTLSRRIGRDIVIAAGSAKVIDIAYASGRLGKGTNARSLHEFIHPTDWDPAEIPSEIVIWHGNDVIENFLFELYKTAST